MTLGDQVELAMVRGRSPYTVLDLLRWLREGRAEMWIGHHLHASVVVLEPPVAEVGHLAGRWNDDECRELIAWMHEVMARKGATVWTWRGRPGWARFLKQRGIEPT